MASNRLLATLSALRGYSVAAGMIDGYSSELKFGYNGAVSTVRESIWTQGGAYVFPASASVMTLSSDSANDAAAGTGARTIQVAGLDADYEEISETVTLNGQSGVNTVESYLRVHRIIVRSAGSSEQNEGVIYMGTGTITAGIPANVFGQVAIGENQTLQAIYTIPAHRTGWLFGISATSFGNANATADIELKVRPEGEVFQTKRKGLLTRGTLEPKRFFPLRIAEKSDVKIDALSSSGTIDVGADFELLLVAD